VINVTAEGAGRDPYLVKSVVHSSKILSTFRAGEALPLREIAERSGLPKTMVFRLLYTLERCGMVEKTGENRYQCAIRPFKTKLYRFGYAAQGTDYRFSKEVTESLKRAAAAEGIDLLSVDNKYNPKIAQRNADLLIRNKVDLVIEFQTDENVASIVASKYRAAGIPLLAIEIPHPGAIYYGANNYEAGLIGGRHMGRWAKHHWQSEVEEILFLELPRAGPLPHMRLTGMLAGIRDAIPELGRCQITHLNGDGRLEESFEVVRKHLRTNKFQHTLIGGVNDASALGAFRAFQEKGRAETCAVMGQNASPEARQELRERGTRMIGSVAYFPENYGGDLIRVALNVLNNRPVPPAVFVKHQLITPETVDHFYPNDRITQILP
jgi:ribose transport system substrate-binding protein